MTTHPIPRAIERARAWVREREDRLDAMRRHDPEGFDRLRTRLSVLRGPRAVYDHRPGDGIPEWRLRGLRTTVDRALEEARWDAAKATLPMAEEMAEHMSATTEEATAAVGSALRVPQQQEPTAEDQALLDGITDAELARVQRVQSEYPEVTRLVPGADPSMGWRRCRGPQVVHPPHGWWDDHDDATRWPCPGVTEQEWAEAMAELRANEPWRPSHPYLEGRSVATLGDAMRLIGRYTESEGGDSPETRQARTNLFDAYDTWCEQGRPETDAAHQLTSERAARIEARVDDAMDPAITEGRHRLGYPVPPVPARLCENAGHWIGGRVGDTSPGSGHRGSVTGTACTHEPWLIPLGPTLRPEPEEPRNRRPPPRLCGSMTPHGPHVWRFVGANRYCDGVPEPDRHLNDWSHRPLPAGVSVGHEAGARRYTLQPGYPVPDGWEVNPTGLGWGRQMLPSHTYHVTVDVRPPSA